MLRELTGLNAIQTYDKMKLLHLEIPLKYIELIQQFLSENPASALNPGESRATGPGASPGAYPGGPALRAGSRSDKKPLSDHCDATEPETNPSSPSSLNPDRSRHPTSLNEEPRTQNQERFSSPTPSPYPGNGSKHFWHWLKQQRHNPDFDRQALAREFNFPSASRFHRAMFFATDHTPREFENLVIRLAIDDPNALKELIAKFTPDQHVEQYIPIPVIKPLEPPNPEPDLFSDLTPEVQSAPPSVTEINNANTQDHGEQLPKIEPVTVSSP